MFQNFCIRIFVNVNCIYQRQNRNFVIGILISISLIQYAKKLLTVITVASRLVALFVHFLSFHWENQMCIAKVHILIICQFQLPYVPYRYRLHTLFIKAPSSQPWCAGFVILGIYLIKSFFDLSVWIDFSIESKRVNKCSRSAT